jgi:hypothetical protein
MFYVLLTVHLGIILVNDQLDAQFFFLICLFQSSICFEQPRVNHQENQLYQYNNNEEHRPDTNYYNLVIRYNLKETPGYMFRPSLGHPQANTNIIKKYRSVLHGIPFRLHLLVKVH